MFAAHNTMLTGAPIPVVYDATGAGIINTGATPGTYTEAHTLGGGASAIMVAAIVYNGAGTPTVSAKIGTTTIPALGSGFAFSSLGSAYSLYLFGLISPPTGTQTVSVTATGGNPYLASNSVSYTRVSHFGSVVTNAVSSGTAASQTVSSAQRQRVFQAFGAAAVGSGVQAFSGYSQTQRSNLASTNGSNQVIVIGDAPGAPTVNFAATSAESGWGGIAVPLIP